MILGILCTSLIVVFIGSFIGAIKTKFTKHYFWWQFVTVCSISIISFISIVLGFGMFFSSSYNLIVSMF